MIPLALVIQPLHNGVIVFPEHWLRTGKIDLSQSLVFTEVQGYGKNALYGFLSLLSDPATALQAIPPAWLSPEPPGTQLELPLD